MENSSQAEEQGLKDLLEPGYRSRGVWLAWLVLLIGLGLTALAWFESHQDATEIARARFDFRSYEMQTDIAERMTAYEQVLRGALGLWYVSQEVGHDEWRLYVMQLKLERNYPGIQGVGYARWVSDAEKAAHIAEMKSHGFPDYTVHPAGSRDFYTPIVYLEPFNWRNQRALGYDMFAETTRRKAMVQAAESGETIMSGKVTLVQETGPATQAGALMYLPHYRRGAPLFTLEQRREALQGFVYSPFRMDDLILGILGRRPILVGMEIFDGRELLPGNRLYATEVGEQWTPSYEKVTHLDLYGRTWTFRFFSLPAFETRFASRVPQAVALTGVVISILLFGIVWTLASTRARAYALAEEMTEVIRERKARLREITSALGEGVYVLDRDGRITFVNPMAQRLLGFSEAELLGVEAHPLFHGRRADGSNLPADQCPVHGSIRTGALYRGEQETFWRKDGRPFPVSITSAPIRRQGKIAGAVVTFDDISEQQAAAQRLRESERFFALFEYARDALFLVEKDGRIVDANRLACDSLGYSREELIGNSLSSFVVSTAPPMRPAFTESIYKQVAQGLTVTMEAEHVRKDGSRFPVETVFSPISQEERQQLLVAVRDVSERKQAEQRLRKALADLEQSRRDLERVNGELERSNRELERLSRQDGLTGVANRRYFDEYMAGEWRRAARGAEPLSLILIDIDHFKAYNDYYGHQAGDECLRLIAQSLQAHLGRPTDLLARYGGEEFAVILPETSAEGACYIAQSLLHAVVSLRIRHEGSDAAPYVTLSLGVSSARPRADSNYDVLVAGADLALYEAKRQGRNRVVGKCADDPV